MSHNLLACAIFPIMDRYSLSLVLAVTFWTAALLYGLALCAVATEPWGKP